MVFLLDRIGPQLLGDDINSLVRLIQRGTPNAPVPAERGEAAAQLVGLMLTVDAKARPSAADVLRHPWMQKARRDHSH